MQPNRAKRSRGWSIGQWPPVVVCERTGRWAQAWRGLQSTLRSTDADDIAFGRPKMTVVESRSTSECSRLLDEHPTAFVVLEWSAAAAESLIELLETQPQRWPSAAMAAVADRSLADAEWLAREAGALHWVTSSRRLRPLVEMALRHLQRRMHVIENTKDAVWSALPWQ